MRKSLLLLTGLLFAPLVGAQELCLQAAPQVQIIVQAATASSVVLLEPGNPVTLLSVPAANTSMSYLYPAKVPSSEILTEGGAR